MQARSQERGGGGGGREGVASPCPKKICPRFGIFGYFSPFLGLFGAFSCLFVLSFGKPSPCSKKSETLATGLHNVPFPHHL